MNKEWLKSAHLKVWTPRKVASASLAMGGQMQSLRSHSTSTVWETLGRALRNLHLTRSSSDSDADWSLRSLGWESGIENGDWKKTFNLKCNVSIIHPIIAGLRFTLTILLSQVLVCLAQKLWWNGFHRNPRFFVPRRCRCVFHSVLWVGQGTLLVAEKSFLLFLTTPSPNLTLCALEKCVLRYLPSCILNGEHWPI